MYMYKPDLASNNSGWYAIKPNKAKLISQDIV